VNGGAPPLVSDVHLYVIVLLAAYASGTFESPNSSVGIAMDYSWFASRQGQVLFIFWGLSSHLFKGYRW
jgi:hypothetical protein